MAELASRIELLRDGKGIYGITPVGLPEKWGHLKAIIIRPDRVIDVEEAPRTALQMTPSQGSWDSTEHSFIKALTESWATEGAKRRGLERLPSKEYFALRARCRRIVNSLMYQVLAVANQGYLRTARRYSIGLRFPIYRACCLYGDRVHQIANTFPIAAVVAYTDYVVAHRVAWDDTARGEIAKAGAAEIRKLVQNGARLKVIADVLTFSKRVRHIWPANVLFTPWPMLNLHREWLVYMPRTIHKQRRWLCALGFFAQKDRYSDYIEWVARHALELGDSRETICARLGDLSDWVSACRDKSTEWELEKLTDDFEILVQKAQALEREPSYRYPELFSSHSGAKLVTREFTPNMSVATVQKLSDEWHEAIRIANFSGHDIKFPTPWYEGGEVNGYTITPIRSRLDLYREGRAMHNCSLTYATRIIKTNCFFYSVTKCGEHVATVMISYRDGQTVVGDRRAVCNGMADRKVRAAVNKWFALNQQLYQNGNRPKTPNVKPVHDEIAVLTQILSGDQIG